MTRTPKSGSRRGLGMLAGAAIIVLMGTSPAAAERLQFNSVALTTIADVLGGRRVATTLPVTGTLTLPAGATGPVPAMVVVPDATGLEDGGRVAFWTRTLLDMGVATLVPESFEARGVERAQAAQRAEVTPDMRVADAFAALARLAADPRIDGKRIGIIGSGAGGSVAVNTAFKPVQHALSQRNLRFAVHIALYPACDAQWQLIDPTGAPIHFLLAGQGRLHLAERCQHYAERIGAAGGSVTTLTFPQAFYGFDSDWDRQNIGGLSSLNRCFFRITDAGVLIEVNKNLSSETVEGREAIVTQCTSFGAVVSRNDAVRANAAEKVREYVQRALF